MTKVESKEYLSLLTQTNPALETSAQSDGEYLKLLVETNPACETSAASDTNETL